MVRVMGTSSIPTNQNLPFYTTPMVDPDAKWPGPSSANLGCGGACIVTPRVRVDVDQSSLAVTVTDLKGGANAKLVNVQWDLGNSAGEGPVRGLNLGTGFDVGAVYNKI